MHEENEQLDNWAKGKKRTCPRCGEVFLSRKNKRIHRKITNFRCEVPKDLAA